MSNSSHEPIREPRQNPLPERREHGGTPQSSAPKPITVDEMVQQLRSPDGKKRRRRSHQPIYDSRRRRRLWAIIGLALATLSVGGCWGFRIFQKWRLEGDTFRDALNRRVSQELGAVVQLSRIHSGGSDALGAASGRLDVPEKDLLEYAEFTNLSARLTSASWVSEEWGITRLLADDVRLRFNPDRPLIKGDTMWLRTPAAAREKSGGGWRMGISPTPGTITVDAFSVSRDLTLEWPCAGRDSGMEGLYKAQAHITAPVTGGLDGRLLRGQLSLKGLPALEVAEAHWKLAGRALKLEGSALSLDSGTVNAAGDIELDLKGGVKCSVDFRRVPVRGLFSEAWKEKLSGLVNVKGATFTASFTGAEERVLEGAFEIEGLIVRDVSFTQRLSVFLQRPDYSQGLEFPTVTGDFRWTPSQGLQISNLRAERPLEVRAGGSLTASPAGRVDGALTFSAHNNLIRGNTYPHPFRPSAKDWFATGFRISGDASALNDDLPAAGPAVTPAGDAPAPPPQAPAPPPADTGKQFNDLLQPQ